MKKIFFLISLSVFFLTTTQAEKWFNYTKKDNINDMVIHNGQIWMATTGGVVVYDLVGNAVAEYTKANGLLHDNVRAIIIDNNGDFWFGTSGGVSKFDGTSWTSYTTTNSGLGNSTISSMLKDKQGNIWLSGGFNGVSKFDGTTWSNFTTSNSGLIYKSVSVIEEDKHGNIWFGTIGGVSKFDGLTWTNYTTANSGLVNNYVETIEIDSQGNIWFGTYEGTSKFNGVSWTNYTTANSGLMSNNIKSIKEDNQGDLWFGTDSIVSKFNGDTWASYASPNSELEYGYITSIKEDSHGNIWLSTYYGVLKFDGLNWETYTSVNSGLVDDNTKSIEVDNQGNIWIGTYENGVSKFDGLSWINYTTTNSGLANINISTILEDSQGNLWFGGGSNGVSKFDGITWTNFTTSNSGLGYDYIRVIEEDKHGNIWFGTIGGISKFDGSNWENYSTDNSGLVNNSIISILEDSQGNIWFGTGNGYISKFDGSNWVSYPTVNSNDILSIGEDNKGNLWFGTQYEGAFKFDGTTWTNYNWRSSKLSGSNDKYGDEVGSLFKDSKGNLWFGTLGGISVLLNEQQDLPILKMVQGRVFYDKNQNQQKEPSENLVPNQRVLIQPGNRTAFTNEQGEYAFRGDTGVNYSLTYTASDFYKTTTNASFSFTLSADSTLPDIGIYRTDTAIYHSNIVLGNARCSQQTTNFYTYTNVGTLSSNAQVMLTLDEDIAINSSFPQYDSLVQNRIYFTLNNFEAGSTRQIKLTVLNPDFTRMGDSLSYNSLLNVNGIIFQEQLSSLVRCSYDPNDKSVSPLPIGEENYSLKKETLTYTIRFQNTGNDTAFYVAIQDTLDANLDWETFTVLATSHKVHTTLDENGLVLFSFDNIIIPDSTTNEKESHGFISYSIQPKQSLADYTNITNTAFIYFDQNPAIATNTTSNVLVNSIPQPLSIKNQNQETIYLFPQPLTNQSELTFKNDGTKSYLQIKDLSGRMVVQKETSGNQFTLNKSEFQSSGLYLYQLSNGSQVKTGKILVE